MQRLRNMIAAALGTCVVLLAASLLVSCSRSLVRRMTLWIGADVGGSAVPFLFLHRGLLSFLAYLAHRVLEIIREFADCGRPTPAASTTLLTNKNRARKRSVRPLYLFRPFRLYFRLCWPSIGGTSRPVAIPRADSATASAQCGFKVHSAVSTCVGALTCALGKSHPI
jgi:hypothetical protein